MGPVYHVLMMNSTLKNYKSDKIVEVAAKTLDCTVMSVLNALLVSIWTLILCNESLDEIKILR